MADYSDKATDEALAELEKRIIEVYEEAQKYVEEKAGRYFNEFFNPSSEDPTRYQKEFEKYQKGIGYTDETWKAWVQTQIARGEKWTTLRDDLARRTTQANVTASDIINDVTPSVFQTNFNFSNYIIESYSDGVSFDAIDESTVRLLMEGSNALLPKSRIDIPKDQEWNKSKMQNAVLQGILSGDDLYSIVGKFQNVTGMNERSALRNARTSVTGAQNAGRQYSYDKASKMGIKLKKEWVACNDDRTRPSHAQMDGVIVDEGKKFPNGLMYPADSKGSPAEVYNCRCTVCGVVDGTSTKYAEETGHTEETYKEWLKGKEEAKKKKNQQTNKQTENKDAGNKVVNVFGEIGLCEESTIDKANEMLSKIPSESLKKCFEKYKDKLHMSDNKCNRGAFYRWADGVYLNESKVVKGDDCHRPMQTFFHEFGHNLDWAMGYISNTYKGELLIKTLKSDYDAFAKKVYNENKVVREGADLFGYKPSTKSGRGNIIARWVRATGKSDYYTSGSVSDALEALSGVAYPLGVGHGNGYWKQRGMEKALPKEFFAEVIDGMCACKESYDLMKEIFPNAVAICEEIWEMKANE